MYQLTQENFIKCFPNINRQNASSWYSGMLTHGNNYYINTPVRLAAFFAQIGHECNDFNNLVELSGGFAYEGRQDLGNIYNGDGPKFKGRGPIQLTGRANYANYGRIIGVDLISNPDLVLIPSIGLDIACVYWTSRGLNRIADENSLDSFKRITRAINGGYNHLTERTIRWNNCKKVLGA